MEEPALHFRLSGLESLHEELKRRGIRGGEVAPGEIGKGIVVHAAGQLEEGKLEGGVDLARREDQGAVGRLLLSEPLEEGVAVALEAAEAEDLGPSPLREALDRGLHGGFGSDRGENDVSGDDLLGADGAAAGQGDQREGESFHQAPINTRMDGREDGVWRKARSRLQFSRVIIWRRSGAARPASAKA